MLMDGTPGSKKSHVAERSRQSETDSSNSRTGPGADLALVALVRRQRITRSGGSRITLSPTASAAKRELHRICTPKATARWLIHMTGGGAKRRPNHAYHSPSTTNAKGCWIAAAGSALDSGYRVAAPFIPRRHGPLASLRSHPIHRLAMRAWGSWELQRAMLEQGHHVSHLCHNRACYNPSHLTVEDSDANIARHACARHPRPAPLQICPKQSSARREETKPSVLKPARL
jgi:hypothetical protein